MKPITTLLVSLLSLGASAQEISGTIINEHKEPVIIGAILVKQNGILRGGACTDYDGRYWVKQLEPGLYDVIAYYSTYDTVTITGIPVAQGQKTLQNFAFTQSEGSPKNIVLPYKKQITEDRTHHTPFEAKPIELSYINAIISYSADVAPAPAPAHNNQYVTTDCQVSYTTVHYKAPEFPLDMNNPISFKLTRKEIETLPTTDLNDMIALAPMTYQYQRGANVQISGARTGGTLYILDGMQIANR